VTNENPKVSVVVEGGNLQGIVGANQVEVGSINYYIPVEQQSKVASKYRRDLLKRVSPRRVFIQFINPEILSLYGVNKRYSITQLYSHAIRLTKYALLLADGMIIMPASYAVEVPFINQYWGEIKPLLTCGILYISSSTSDWKEYLKEKASEYRDELNLFPGYAREEISSGLRNTPVNWAPRLHSASRNIGYIWKNELYKSDGMWNRILENLAKREHGLPRNLDSSIEKAPEALDGRAFIHRFVMSVIPAKFTASENTQVSMLLSRGYLESYLGEYDALILNETPIGLLDCGINQYGVNGEIRTFSFRKLHNLFRSLKLDVFVEELLGWYELIEIQDEPIFRWFIDNIIIDVIDPLRPFSKALLEIHYPLIQVSKKENSSLNKIKVYLYQLYDLIQPILDKNSNFSFC
jgi:hypothetical protein